MIPRPAGGAKGGEDRGELRGQGGLHRQGGAGDRVG
ncbi:MAG: SOS response-associated peptidase, partial [Nitrospirae bacterium]